jgi:hypothetical protein
MRSGRSLWGSAFSLPAKCEPARSIISGMDLNAIDEFDKMIWKIATDESDPPGRAVVAMTVLCFVEPKHVPEGLKGELLRLKSLGEGAQSMDAEAARNFISSIFSFRDQLIHSAQGH